MTDAERAERLEAMLDQMAETNVEANAKIFYLTEEIAALRAALALREQAQRDALAVLHRAHFYIMAQQFYTNGKTCDDCGGITEHCKGCATAELLAEIASILEALAALPRGEREG